MDNNNNNNNNNNNETKTKTKTKLSNGSVCCSNPVKPVHKCYQERKEKKWTQVLGNPKCTRAWRHSYAMTRQAGVLLMRVACLESRNQYANCWSHDARERGSGRGPNNRCWLCHFPSCFRWANTMFRYVSCCPLRRT